MLSRSICNGIWKINLILVRSSAIDVVSNLLHLDHYLILEIDNTDASI